MDRYNRGRYHVSKYVVFSHIWFLWLCCFVEHEEISNHADPHNVDEDLTTIPSLGEHWCGIAFAGLHCRHTDWSVDWYTNTVASSNMQKYKIIRICMKSTKMWLPAWSMVEVGDMKTMQVPCFDIWTCLRSIRMVLLLRCVDIWEISNYTDWLDVDEDERTSIIQGGSWVHNTQAGIAVRNMDDAPFYEYTVVASLKK